GDAAEAENGRHDRDDEEDYCVMKHFCLRRSLFCDSVPHICSYPAAVGGYRRRPRLHVGRVRRTPTAAYMRYVATIHFATPPRVLRWANGKQHMRTLGTAGVGMPLFDGPIQLIRLKRTARR